MCKYHGFKTNTVFLCRTAHSRGRPTSTKEALEQRTKRSRKRATRRHLTLGGERRFHDGTAHGGVIPALVRYRSTAYSAEWIIPRLFV